MELKKAYRLQKAVANIQNAVLDELAEQGANIPDELHELMNAQQQVLRMLRIARTKKTK